jgi:pilus assembly protein CpaE
MFRGTVPQRSRSSRDNSPPPSLNLARRRRSVQQTSVVLGVDDPALQEEILHFLERLPHVRVVGAAEAAAEVTRRIRETEPDAAVVSSRILADVANVDGATLLVVGERETTSALRIALRAGARGFYLWPEERESLARAASRARRPAREERPDQARVVAVYGPRGGVGTTFLATNLAAACARAGGETLLVDLDVFFADVTAAVGLAGRAEGLHTLAELAPVLDELTSEHVDRVVQEHPAGFRMLLAPEDSRGSPALTAPHVAGMVQVLRSRFDAVVLHLPRALDDAAIGALEAADDVLVVLSLDVMAFRDARRALDHLSGLGLEGKCRLVINRAARSEVVPGDAERVFGMAPVAVIRFDRAVPRAQNRGELVVGRSSRAARSVFTLARRLLEGDRS